eukprot:353046-Chlamydomonas_euryale.AAC.1
MAGSDDEMNHRGTHPPSRRSRSCKSACGRSRTAGHRSARRRAVARRRHHRHGRRRRTAQATPAQTDTARGFRVVGEMCRVEEEATDCV